MKTKTPKPLLCPQVIPITPRLLAAVEAAAGRRFPPGCQVIVNPPVPARTILDPKPQPL